MRASRSIVVSLAMLAAGLSLLAASAVALAGPSQAGGTLRVVSSADVDSLDPALVGGAGGSFELLIATCDPLWTSPRGTGVADYTPRMRSAVGFPQVSPDGRTYVVTLRPGLRFSDGTPITAASFAAAINRILAPRMQAYLAQYFTDIVGAKAVQSGDAPGASGVIAKGRTLTLKLERPAGDLVARLAFVCPVPPRTPADPGAVGKVPGSGPYYVASRVPGRSIVLRRNPYYGGPRRGHVSEIGETIAGDPESNSDAVERGVFDYTADGPPSDRWTELVRRYGVGKSHLFRSPNQGLFYLAMNTSRPLFKDNADLRRAVNFALDRPEIFRQLPPGNPNLRTDQVIPEGMPGFRDVDLYTLKGPNLKVAQRLARGHTGGGHAVLYVWNTPSVVKAAEIVRFDLGKIGLDVEVKSFSRPVHVVKTGTRDEPFDLSFGFWCADYLDPAQFVDVLLNGNRIAATGNTNISYFDEPAVNRKIEAANTLPAPGRYVAFARLDAEIMRTYAPWAPLWSSAQYHLASGRVGCFRPFDYAAWCLEQ